jgi:class 3 adenylate cyclase/tetratricopeptide (TPR) repeat protein
MIRALWGELRRRKVIRVAVVYVIVAWVVIQVADTVFPHLPFPHWVVTLVIVFCALGLPVALVLAWAYDITPDGVRRTATPLAPGGWERLGEVLASALELPTGERALYLERACAGEPRLRREVESLLAAHARPSVLDRPVPTPAAPLDATPSLSRSAPHYQLLEKVGGGGMGVVYKARDRRLERVVALKFLPPHLSADEAAASRFLVEAQAAAALDHPNICTVYEAGETDDGRLFLAMPFYEGETLKRRLARGPLAVDEALDVATQVLGGLAKAHERGIVHRDIKPANLVLTADGVVKIVDFGVAKLADVSVTRPGMTIGTVAYMSPEQAGGEEVDGRTDLWAVGVVLYEMLTGERPFRGGHDRVLLDAISTTEPTPIRTLRSDVPAPVADAVLRALAKRRADRYADARDMASALEALRGDGAVPRARAAVRTSTGDALLSAESGNGVAASDPLDSGETTANGVLAEGERRQATVVVSAVAGYDDLVERWVPGEVERLLGRLRGEAEAVAAAHGGVLNQFTGEEMVLLFGVPTTREDDGVRAARAALELHARIASLNAGAGDTPLDLHTGIDTGRVVTRRADGDGRAFRIAGAAPQIAARLAQHAGRGEVWVSPECLHLIGPYFESEARDPIALRDRKQPLVPHRLIGESGLQTRLEASQKVGLTAYTGRDAELATLRRCFEGILSGDGQMVTITGEPGMGKSRLLHEFREGLAPGVPVLVGRCQPYGGGVAYLPFLDVLRGGLGLGEGGAEAVDGTVARIREISPALEEFVPLYLHLLSIPSTAFPLPRHLQGDAFRLAMQEALAAILTLGAGRGPTVLVLEDWHWADEASQTVLRQVAEVVDGCPLLVLVTARPGYGVAWGAGQHTAVALRPLEPGSTAAMLRALLGVDRFPDELGGLIHERTGGNPFFIEEICQALLEEGALRVEENEARLAGPLQSLELPDSIQAVIRARLDRLDRDARDVLRLAAVVGREFTRDVLESAVADVTILPRALESLKSAGLVQQTRVVPDAGYRFKHVLTQEVAYASLLEHQRRELHGRVGEIIEALHGERLDDQLDRLAHHFSRAEAWPKAVRYGLLSAERANALAQFAEALQILERTQRWLARLPAGEERAGMLVDVLLRQERLCETLGQRARQQQLIDELIATLRDASDPARLAEVSLRQGDLFILLRRFDDAEEALNRSLRLRREMRDPVGERNTLRSLGLLRWHEGRNREALEFAEQTVRIDRERGDRVALVGDLTNCGAILRAMGEHDRALALVEEALEISEHPAEPGGAETGSDELAVKCVYALHHLANIYQDRGDRARALGFMQRARELAERNRLPVQLAYHSTSVAHLHLQEGNIEESLRHYREAIEMSRRARYALGLAQSLRIFGEVLVGLGRHDEALPQLQEAAGIFADLRDADGEARMWSAIAGAEERLGRQANAMAAWGRASALMRQVGDRAGELEAAEGLARTTRQHLPEPTLALTHYEHALELACDVGDRAAEGRIRNVLGILEWSRGEHARALAHYERGHAVFTELGDAAHAGLMLNSAGLALQALGRLDDAERRLHEAVALHRESGARQLEGHALALLGDVCTGRDEPGRAADFYRQSLEIRRAIGDRRGEGWMLHHLARAELADGQPYEVRERAETAARIAAECGDAELTAACARLRRVAD